MILNIGFFLLNIIPIVFMGFLLLTNPLYFRRIKQIAFVCSLLLLLIYLFLFFEVNCFFLPFQKTHGFNLNVFFNINYVIGLDIINLLFIGLTLILMPLCILISWDSIYFRVKWFFFYLLLIEFFLINVFLSLDLIPFYIFFEGLLIPLFLLIIGWGSRERRIHASFMLFFYTLIGSLLMLIAIIFLHSTYGTTNLYILRHNNLSEYRQIFLWLAFFFSFGAKIPMMPFHIWLPEAHVEAPTACSVLLAGILLKLGTYGFLRFSFLLFPKATVFFSTNLKVLALMAIIYCSFVIIRQVDIKKIIAYSSIIHMNFALLGLFTFNVQAISGSIFLMLSHGLVSSGLFICVGFIYDRYHTRLFQYYNGLVTYMPLYSTILFFFFLANMGFPGTCGFPGEFLITIGVFEHRPLTIIYGGISLIFCGIYSIWLYNRIVFSYLKPYNFKLFADLNIRELCVIVPLLCLLFFFGLDTTCISHLYDVFVYFILVKLDIY